ncbi:hypothetical protein Q9L58_008413 [Maublancomyces gigas]|uniref:Ankyrin repeat protein n=1 Tax=Discina gigas TaxID=1032678 RepID=A0ABR3G9Q8_9PEZI
MRASVDERGGSFKENYESASRDLSSDFLLLLVGVLETPGVAQSKERRPNSPKPQRPRTTYQHHGTANWRRFPVLQVAVIILSIAGTASSANATCTPPECAPAEGWDNFANNLGSDIAPLLALFGESVTTQYLNESFGILDSLIFALAPLGIITAIVAAIRVAGEPILRSLIGKAKESRGNVEADLMSSTSSDVCELWNGEGVVRVLGSPVLLQLVAVSGPAGEIETIYTFNEAVREEIYKVKGGNQDMNSERIWNLQNPPNLSLNVSITPMKHWILVVFVVLGVLLQGGVLVFAAIAQYKLRLQKNDLPPVAYGFPVFVIGTLSLAVGMFLCAHEVEISTIETTWVPQKNSGSVIWLQQGGQTVGDQRFESFSRVIRWSESDCAANKIITSSKLTQDTKKRRFYVMTAISTALVGFVVQFAGLRVMHSSVIVVQLGAVLIMTVVRSCAHIQRSAQNDIKDPDRVEGHELDWLAKEMAKCKRWEVITWPSDGRSVKESAPNVTAVKVMKTRARLAELSKDWKLEDRAKAKILRSAIETTINQISSTMTLNDTLKGDQFTWAVPVKTELEDGSLEESSINLVLTRKAGESRIWSPWETDERELEAVLCLWISTLTDDIRESTRENKPQLKNTRLFGLDTNEIKLDYNLWIDRGTTTKKEKLDPNKARYFGRVARDRAGGSERVAHDRPNTPPDYLCAESKREIELLCAQELYAVFMSELVHGITDVGGVTRKRVDNAADEEGSAGEKFHLHNSNLASLATIYKSCGLGTTEEAYFSIIPAFRAVKRLPEPRKASRKLEKDGLWDQATEIDLWLYKDPKDTQLKRRDTVIINGEIRNRLLRLTRGLAAGIAGGGESNAKLRKMWNAAYLRCEKLEEVSEERARSLVYLTTTCERIKPGTDLGTVFRLASDTLQKLDGKKKHTAEIVASLARFALEKELLSEAEILAKFLWVDMITRWEGSRMESNHFVLKLLMDVRRTRGHVLINTELKEYLSVQESRDRAAKTDVNTGVSTSDLEDVPLDFLSIRKYQTPLQMTAGAGYADLVTILLNAQADVNADPAKYSGRTALQAAAEAGDYKIMKSLLSRSADINAKPAKYSGRTALQAAAEAGHARIIRTLRYQGADVNAGPAEHSGRTALQAAAEAGHTEIVKFLLKSINTNTTPTQSRERIPSPLSTGEVKSPASGGKAAGPGRQLLRVSTGTQKIHPKADVNAAPATYSGRTALQAASGAGHIELVSLLLADGADINAPPAHSRGRTALQAAAEGGHADIVELLLKYGPDVNAKPAQYSGQTALQAAAGNGHERIVTRLLSAKANVNGEPAVHSGRTALQAAAEAGHINIVELLLKERADVDAEPAEHSGRTALQAAAGSGHEWVVTRLLLAKVNVNAEPATHFGRTALQAAAEAGNINIVELLLKESADVNGEPAEFSGRTALQAAAEAGHELILTRLLSAKANVNAEPAKFSGRTALQAASGAGHAEIIDLLLAAGADINALPAGDSGRTALQASAEAGLSDIVELLLEEKAEVDAKPATYSGRTALQAAAGAGHIAIVKRLLDAGANVDAKPASHSGRTALQASAEAGRTKIVDLLLGKADVNAEPALSSGQTAPQAAAGADHTEIVETLLEANVDAKPASHSGRTALQASAEAGRTKIVDLRPEKKADVNAEPALSSGRTALQAAAGAGHTEIVITLLEANANVDANPAEYSGRTALQAAAEAGFADIVELLLQKNADVNAAPGLVSGRTALQAAAGAGHIDIVERLLKAGAKFDAEPAVYSGRSALQAAIEAGHTRIVEIFLGCGAKVNIQPTPSQQAAEKDFQTPLQLAVEKAHLEIVKLLIKAKADVNTPPTQYAGRTALQTAAEAGYTEIVKLLLDNKADVNAEPAQSSGRTALQAAAEAGHLGIVNILLDKASAKADVNAAPAYYFGRTALQAAAGAGHVEIVIILLGAGAEVNAEPAEYSGRMALQAAVEAGHTKIVDLLLDKGANVRPISGIPLHSIAESRGYKEIVDLFSPPVSLVQPKTWNIERQQHKYRAITSDAELELSSSILFLKTNIGVLDCR